MHPFICWDGPFARKKTDFMNISIHLTHMTKTRPYKLMD